MYEWRNGQDEDAEMSVDALLFRDNKFVAVEKALGEYATIQEYYTPEPDSIRHGFELRDVFPFAEFMGSRHVLVCGEHTLDWDPETAGLSDNVELEIWRKHNPGIFPR